MRHLKAMERRQKQANQQQIWIIQRVQTTQEIP